MAKDEGIHELASGRWHWRVQVNGRRLRGTADTKAEARRARAQAFIDAGGTPELDDVTVAELIDMFTADAGHNPHTARVRDDALERVPDTFKARPARTVSPPIVAALWRQMEADGVSAHTIQKAANALSKSFALAVTYGMVPANPVRAAKPKPPPKSAEISPPSPADVRRLIEHFDARGRAPYATFVRLMAVIGARPGEMCALRWDQFDADRATLRVGPSVERSGAITEGKNGPSGHRTIHLDLPSCRQLGKLERIVGSPWIFTHDGRTPWRPQGVGLEIRRAVDKLGLTMRPYDLRHFAATQALAAGVPVRDVAYMLGDNAATVLRVYAHAIPEQSRATHATSAALDDARSFGYE